MKSTYNSAPSVSPHRSSYVSNVGSHLTILKPRESSVSNIWSSLGNFSDDEKEKWYHRAKLVFRVLSFCLGPGNIWRFPQEAFIHGNATYIYVYILYVWLFGVSLLVFEISLSQYFLKGFAKIFTLCPIMEGITLSMLFYCIMANMLYSIISVYSLIYIFSGLHDVMEHSYCSKYIKKHGCESNYTSQAHSPEYAYFFHYIDKSVDIFGEMINWRNATILAFIWASLCIIVLFGFLKHTLVYMVLSILIFVVLLYTAIIGMTMKGAEIGLTHMFSPRSNDVFRFRTWIYPVEQCVVSLGVGAGPLTTLWNVSKIKYWSHIDCVLINLIAFSCSLLSGIAFFSAVGVVAFKNNATIDDFFVREEAHVHILLTQMFNVLTYGLNNFTLCAYYFMLFCSCCFSLLEFVQIMLLYVGSYYTVKSNTRKPIIIGLCVILYLISIISVSKEGYNITTAINKNFIATALLIIISFELISVSYFYGMSIFCDDLDFMLGFVPNYFYQATWLLLPLLFGVFAAASLYLKFHNIRNTYDLVILCLTLIFTVIPVVVFAVYKCVKGIRERGIRRVLNPRIYQEEWESSQNDATQLSSSGAYSSLYNNLYRNDKKEPIYNELGDTEKSNQSLDK